MYKVDLHTHSIASPDGALTLAQYRRMLDEHRLDYIAITDHNTIVFALEAHAVIGDYIIVGEEVTTIEGEIIGLFLSEPIPSGLSLADAVARIKKQNGLVYVPHPFEKVRSGVSPKALDSIAASVDIIETRNGRAIFENRSKRADEWAVAHKLPGAASSDSHGWYGWGNTYSMIDHVPLPATLPQSLHAARYALDSPGLRGVLYPKFNRLRKGR